MGDTGNFSAEKTQIRNLGAWLFWLLVRDSGYAAISRDVIATNGSCIITEESIAFIKKIGVIPDLEDILAIKNVNSRVAFEIYVQILNSSNPIGTIYEDELYDGRDISSVDLDFKSALADIPVLVGDVKKLPQAGSLLLRSPLPAIVASHERIDSKYFLVKETQKAFGHTYPLIFSIRDEIRINGNYAYTGHVFVPVRGEVGCKDWVKIIPNSLFFNHKTDFLINDEVASVCPAW